MNRPARPSAVVARPLGSSALALEMRVPRGHPARARAILCGHRQESSERETATPRTAWTCPNCGKAVDPGFEVCSNCQTPRPGRPA